MLELGWEHGVFNFDAPENVIIHQNDLDKTKYRIYMRYPDPEKEGEEYALYSPKSDEYLSLRLLKSGEVLKSTKAEFKVDKDGLVLFDIFDTGIPYDTGAPNILFVHPFNFSDPVNLWYYNKVISYQDDGVLRPESSSLQITILVVLELLTDHRKMVLLQLCSLVRFLQIIL